MITHEKCPICGAKEFHTALKCNDYLVSQREFIIKKCSSCGFMFTHDIPGPGEIESFYESPEYISHTGGNRSLTDKLYVIARKIMLGSKARSVRRFSPVKSGRLLDIGAGTGHFVRKMLDSGWESVGVEVNENARKHAFIINRVRLISSLRDGGFTTNSFNAVTMWHVLEHIHEPEIYLGQIASILKPDGILIVALPNTQSADALHYAENWAAYDVPRHLWHFNNNNIDELLNRTGFVQVKVKRMPFDAFYISLLSEKNMCSRFPIVKGLLKGLFFSVWAMLKKERSSSLMYIYKVNN
jgi:SAM-dependent methyltransferase